MMVMYSNSKAIDPVIIADALAKDGKYDEAGGRDYLLQLAQSVDELNNEMPGKLLKMQQAVRLMQQTFWIMQSKVFIILGRAGNLTALQKSVKLL